MNQHPHQNGPGQQPIQQIGSLTVGHHRQQPAAVMNSRNIMIDVIEVFNLWGKVIILIEDEYYTADTWEPSDLRSTHIHLLQGRRITNLLMSYANRAGLAESNKGTILQQIAGLPTVRREWHHSVLWTKYDIATASNQPYNPSAQALR